MCKLATHDILGTDGTTGSSPDCCVLPREAIGQDPRTGIKYEVDWDDGVVAWHPAGNLLTLDVLHNLEKVVGNFL
jgi:hypothetical protein